MYMYVCMYVYTEELIGATFIICFGRHSVSSEGWVLTTANAAEIIHFCHPSYD
jgi:hypothetical protein